MIDMTWKDIATSLLTFGAGGALWWCKRIQAQLDRLTEELVTLREGLPLAYVLKTDNGERLQRIEDKLDRVIERMGGK